MQKQINLDLKSLYKWRLANKISLNCSKTELIFFHKPGNPIMNYTFNIKLNGHKIHPSSSIKYLGMHLDSTLSGNEHCKILASKLKRANGMLNKIRHYVPKDELRSIYHAIFSSHMVYSCQVWGQNHSSHMDKICKLQNRALRIINFKDFNANPSPLYKKECILKLPDLIKTQNVLLVHDYLNNKLPKCFQDYYFKMNYLYFNVQTRNSKLGCLFTPSKNTTRFGLKSITQQCIYNWNFFTKTLKHDLLEFSRKTQNTTKTTLSSAILMHIICHNHILYYY